MLNFLTANNIMDMAGLDEKISSMIGEQKDIRDKLKPIDRRLPVLKKHIEQADVYLKYKGKKALSESEQILLRQDHPTDKGVESGIFQADRRMENTQPKVSCTDDEVKKVEQIRKSVYSILRQEQREQQPRRAQETER